MANNDPKTIEKPPSAQPPKKEDENVVIHVMPKEYLGKVASVKEQPKPAPTPPPPPKPAPKPPLSQPQKKKSKLPLILIAIGLILIVILGVGAYFVLESIQEETPMETPDPEPEPEPDPEPEPEPDPEPEEPTPGQDTDSDGLTDVEEQLYGTDFRNPDTDGDTFLDGNEVFHRFDPLGFAPSTLLDTGSVQEFSDAAVNFTYPRRWNVDSGEMTYQVNIPGSTAMMTISAREKSVDSSIEDWYELEIAPGNGAHDISAMISKNGLQGLSSSDELVTYLDGGTMVWVFTYDLGDETRIDYLQTFQMMINSFNVAEGAMMEEDATEESS